MRTTDASASTGLDTTALRVAAAIAEHADERPETVAVVHGDSRLTYARLAARAEAIRTSLVERGVRTGDRVALVLPPGCAQVAAVVGVLAAGAAYVPIAPEEPAARRAHILADADPVLTVVGSDTHLEAVDGAVHIGDLDIDTADDTAPLRPAPVAGDDPIYIMYTSGTTGAPKGVALTHGGVGNFLHALVERCRLDDVESVLMRTRFSFDASVPELLLPLAFGKTIVVASDGRDLPAVLDLVAEHHVQMVTMVPSLTAALLTSGAPLRALAEVRRWLSVGEALPARTARDLLERASVEGSPMQLFNMYGPTEASVFLSGGRVFEDDVRTGLERVRLGRPLRNYRVHVLVPGSLDAVAPGDVGEICVAGPGVGLGYLGRTVTRAFTEEPTTGHRMYRTGDLGCVFPDGTLDFRGRRDDQVKIRGLRVELGEVDARLAACAGVVDAGSAVVHDGSHDTLVAAVVLDDPGAGTWGLPTVLADSLPAPMIPTTIVAVPALPTTPNGKLDRAAVAAAAAVMSPIDAAGTDGTLDADEALLAEVLLAAGHGRPTGGVGAASTAYDLGVDSLGATVAAGMLRARGRSLPVRDVLEGHTLRVLATRLRTFESADVSWTDDGWQPSAWRPHGEAGVDAVAPLIPVQEGLLAIAAQDPSSTHSIVQQVYDVAGGRIDGGHLAAALREVTRRRAALRTSIRATTDGYEQVIHSAPTTTFASHHITRPGLADDVIAADRSSLFDLGMAPLARLTWITGVDGTALVLTYHHVILDGPAQDALVAELVAEHDRIATGVVAPDADATNAAVREDVRAHTSRLRALAHAARTGTEAASSYFRDLLTGLEPDRSLALFRSRTPDGAPIGSVSVAVPPAVGDAAEALARATGVTISSVVEAAWGVLLRQFSGVDDVAYAKVVTRRDLPIAGTSGAIGPLFATIPARARGITDESVHDLVRRTHAQSIASTEHATLRLEDAMRAADQPAGQLQTLYLFENQSASRRRSEEAGVVLRPGSTEQTGFDLTLVASRSSDGLHLTGLHDGKVMGSSDVASLLRRMVEVLSAMTAAGSSPARLLPVTAPGDEEVLAQDAFVLSPSPHPRIEEVFDQVASRYADRCALRHGDRTLSYRELDAAAHRCAEALRRAGASAGDVVGVAARRGIEPIVAMLGVLRLGAAYVPVDLDAPLDRLTHVVRGGGLHVLVTDPVTTSHTGTAHVRTLGVDLVDLRLDARVSKGTVVGDGTGEDGREPLAREPGLSVDAPAYIIHTSGTTGLPKAVSVPHRGVTRLVMDPAYSRLHGDQTVLQTVALTFDVSTLEIWGALLTGATLVVTDQETLVDAVALRAAVRRERISWMWLTTSLFNLHADADPHLWDGMDTVVVGGEKLSERHVRAFFAANDTTVLIDGYGPTEATTLATSHVVERDFVTIPIGRPIPRTGAHVVSSGRVVGCLLPGELWITGDGVALGYLGDAARTAASFVPSPAGDGTAYRTGDVVRRNLDGTLEYLGRVDDQVKIHGHRVETDEVAAALLTGAEVTQAAVLARTGAAGRSELVGFVVATDVAESTLRGRLVAALPPHAVPARIHLLTDLPRTSSGKTDRSRLLATAAERDTAPASPDGADGAGVERLYSVATGAVAVGPDSDFFSLGGDSLTAMRLVHLLRNEGADVRLRDVLAAPTPRLLSELLDDRASIVRTPGDEGATTPTVLGPKPWATARGAVAAHLRAPDSRAHNVPFALLVDGQVDLAVLRSRVDALIRRQPMLRTRFTLDRRTDSASEWLRQETLPADGAPAVDVSRRTVTEPSEWTTESIHDHLRRAAVPFDLARGPLVRVEVVSACGIDLVVADVHHSVFDGTSLDVFLAAVSADADRGVRRPVTARPSEPDTADLEHWRARFASLPAPVDLDLAWERSDSTLGTTSTTLAPETSDAVRTRCAALGITEYALFASAAAVVLQRYTLAEDLVVGMPVDLRRTPSDAESIGMWVSTLPVRIGVSDDHTVRHLLTTAGAEVLDALDHASTPLDAIQTAVQAEHPGERVDLLHAIVAVRRAGRTSVDLGGVSARLVGPVSIEAKTDLEFTVELDGDTHVVGIEHRRSAVDDDTAAGMLEQLLTLIADLASADPGSDIGALAGV
jgi:amino acid adenylation domain-containing protein